MKNKIIVLSVLLSLAQFYTAQSNALIVPATVRLPKDSLLTRDLIKTLNSFLDQKEKPNNENLAVLQEDLPETSALLDEIKGIEKSAKFKDDNFYKCYLLNVLRLDSARFLLQFSYMGVNENMPVLRAGFKVLAKRSNNQYHISSPLKYYTASWKIQSIGNTQVVYQASFNKTKAKKYFSTIARYDKKLNFNPGSGTLYACASYEEALRILGVDYKSDYNGSSRGARADSEAGHLLRVDGSLIPGNYEFDPHDLWHSRLHRVVAASAINRPVDEGTAYLYGGSWGLSWDTILSRFKAFARANPNANWLTLYNESKNFDEKAKFPLNVDFAINALLVQEIEKQKGFPAVIELVSCGKKEEGNENYFKTLEKITGISKQDFNATIWRLIK